MKSDDAESDTNRIISRCGASYYSVLMRRTSSTRTAAGNLNSVGRGLPVHCFTEVRRADNRMATTFPRRVTRPQRSGLGTRRRGSDARPIACAAPSIENGIAMGGYTLHFLLPYSSTNTDR